MELAILKAIQSLSCPALDILFQLITLCGEPLALVLLFAVLYWTGDKQQGERLGFSLAVSLPLCGILKEAFHFPRPIGQEGIRSLRRQTATGYSFPSGHSQSAAAAYGALALAPGKKARRRAAHGRWAYGALMLLVGLSRLYLGVHYPKDVLAGLALGLLCAWGTGALFSRVQSRGLCYLFFAALLLPSLFFFGGHELYAALGCLTGFAFAMLFEHAFVGFTTEVPLETKLFRLAGGLILLGIVGGLLQALLPQGGPYTLLRYALLVFAGAGLYPWLFTAIERALWRRRYYLDRDKDSGKK